ncbi:hypothetical protein MBLNU459_g2241t1 [Dothideomycetes sp. NU459]
MSDNELDAELLALAGDDSSDEEETQQRESLSRSPSEQPAKSVEKTTSPAARGVAQKTKSRGGRGAVRKRRKDDSEEEEGEASTPSSPQSLGSAAMDESDSETSPGDLDGDAPLYPIDGKFRSEGDRQEVMAMTEIQREEILAERAAEVERKAQDQQLKRILQQRRREEAQGAERRKRKAVAADLEDDARKSSRQKVVKPSGPLEEYKKQRELKGAQKARGADRGRDDRSPSRDNGDSDRDAEGDSEVEWDDKPRASGASHEVSPADLRDYERVRVGRTNFAKVCFYPTFESTIKGCYVRVSIGINRDTGEPQYRMAQIKGFTAGRPYAMEGPNGKQFYTDQYALVAHGKAEKEWPFNSCSDSKFSEAEFERYKRALATDTLRVPTQVYLRQKLDDIHTLLDHQWTEQDIQNKINRTKTMHDKFFSYGRDKILSRRNEAAARGDDAAVAKLDQELAAMDGSGVSKPLLNGTKNATPNKAILQQERLAALNKANRKANTEEIRKAQVAEKRAQQKARDEAIAKARLRDAEAAEAAKNKLLAVPGKDDDLFGSDVSRAGTPVNGSSAKGTPRSGTPLNGTKKTLGGFKKKAAEDDVIAAMDLGIDIDIDI